MQCIVLIMLFLGCAAIGTAQDTPCAMVRGIIKLSPYLGDRCKEPLYVIDGKVYCCCNKRFYEATQAMYEMAPIYKSGRHYAPRGAEG